MNFKNYFESLKLVQKIELYLIVLILQGFIFLYFEDIKSFFYKDIQNSKVEVVQDKNNTNRVKNDRIDKISDNELLQFIFKSSDRYNLFVNEYEIYKNHIEVKLDGPFEPLIKILLYFQEHLNITSFELQENQENNNDIILDLVIKKDYFYNSYKSSEIVQNKIEALQIISPFQNKSQNEDTLKKQESGVKLEELKLSAIIKDEVLIDGKWYKQGDSINQNKILKIDKNTITIYDAIKGKNLIKGITYE